MKTKFEKFFVKIVHALEKMGVDITANMGRIGDIITDYYGQSDIKYAAQCIKFELDRGFSPGSKPGSIPGIRESLSQVNENNQFSEDAYRKLSPGLAEIYKTLAETSDDNRTIYAYENDSGDDTIEIKYKNGNVYTINYVGGNVYPCDDGVHISVCRRSELADWLRAMDIYPFSEAKNNGISESAEADAGTEFDKNEEFNEYVDQVLDELDKYGSPKVYDYYSEHRDELAGFMKDNMDPQEVAEELTEYFDETGEPEYDPEHEAYLRDEEEYEAERGAAYNKTALIPGMDELQKLHGSDKMLTHPTGADGQWATESFPISYAISENDVGTLYEYLDNGIPSRIITGDDEDEEVIPWEEQYSQEFEQDYALLTRKVAIEHKDINDALKFMLENVDNFILSPYDLYNIFTSSKSNDNLLCELIMNYKASITESELDEPLSYFDPITINQLEAFVNDMLMY